MKRIWKLIVVTIILMFVVACGSRNIKDAQDLAEKKSITIKDDLSREVILLEVPERIVSLAPNITEILYELDLESKIVGVTKHCDYPSEVKLKDKIDAKNLESIISLKPDLVIAAGIVPKESIIRLDELGIKVVAFEPNNIEDALKVISRIGEVTRKKERAKEVVAALRLRLDVVKDRVGNMLLNNSRPKVFYEIWYEPLYTAGDNTFINDLIKIAGGENIGAYAQGEWPQYSLERLLVENPSIYIASRHKVGEANLQVEDIKSRPSYKNIAAIKNNKVYIMNPDIVNRPGPRIIEGLEAFARVIHPDIKLEN